MNSISVEALEPGMELIHDYKNNDAHRNSFNRLAKLVFGIDIDEWHRMGFWDDRYICHSIVYEDEIIANISASRMDLIIKGANKNAIQLGAVMTHPDYRGRGLSRFLMNQVVTHYERECDFMFLFANADARDFYPKFDFVPVSESKFSLDVQELTRVPGSIRQLHMTDQEDLELIKNCVRTRKAISHEFGLENDLSIFMFNALHAYRSSLFYLKNEHAIVVYIQKGDELHLYDVVTQGDTALHTLLPKIVNEHTRRVHFYFTPDLFTEHALCETLDRKEDQLFIKPVLELINSRFRAPKLAHA